MQTDPDPTDATGELISAQDRYRVIRKIGEGGMGAVFEVEHVLVGRRFALKTLHAEFATNAEAVARFHREARAAGAVGDQHIVEVTDMGKLPDGQPFIVMELLDGVSLAHEIERVGALPVERAIRIALQCCRALAAAHAKGIVHRDLKPDNIILLQSRDTPDFVKLVDFGISKFREAGNDLGGAMTRTGTAMGTPFYMSPEQLGGVSDIDLRTDVYAMGVMLFEMLTSRRPFDAPTLALLAVQVLTQQAPVPSALRPGIPPGLDGAVARAMAKERAHRFPTMGDLAGALEPFRGVQVAAPADRRVLQGASALNATTPQTWQVAAQSVNALPPRRWRTPALISGALVAVLGAAVVGVLVADAFTSSHHAAISLAPTSAPPSVVEEPSQPAPSAPAPSTLAVPPATPTQPTVSPAAEAPQVRQRAPTPAAPTRETRRSDVRTRPSPPPATSRPAESAPRPEPTATRRRVTVQNNRQAEVSVTLQCGDDTTTVRVPAGASRSVTVAADMCRVRCSSAAGLPICPLRLPPTSSSIAIR